MPIAKAKATKIVLSIVPLKPCNSAIISNIVMQTNPTQTIF